MTDRRNDFCKCKHVTCITTEEKANLVIGIYVALVVNHLKMDIIITIIMMGKIMMI